MRTPRVRFDGEGARGRLAAAFWAAVAISLLANFVPFGRYLLYPFALLATWAHEMGHGLTAIVMGGSFEKLELYQDLGGVAFHSGRLGRIGSALVSAGGLLGPALAGGAVVVLGSRPRMAPAVTGALGAALLLSLLWVRNPFGVAAVLALGLGAAGLALKGGEVPRLVVTQLVGIQLCLGSLSDFDYMFTRSFQRDGATMTSDTQHMAEQLWLPYWVWGALIALLSLTILAAAFYLAWVRGRRQGPPPGKLDPLGM